MDSINFKNKLESPPRYSKYIGHHWADHIELLCIINLDGEITVEDIVDRVKPRVEDLGEGDIDDVVEADIAQNTEFSKPAYMDKWSQTVSDWFRLLQYRSTLYSEYYPFEVDGDFMELKNEVTLQHKIYIYFLICSNLYLVDKQTMVALTGHFEIMGLKAFRNFLPPDAIIEIFGKNPLNTGKFGSGTFWDKVNSLAQDLNEVLNPGFKQDTYPNSNTADGGLDLVAWLPTGDSLNSKIIFLGQCACTDKWISKQHDSSYSDWRQLINLKAHTNNVILIPFCFRNANGLWFDEVQIKETYLLDRKRLIYNLHNSIAELHDHPVISVVEDVINIRETIV